MTHDIDNLTIELEKVVDRYFKKFSLEITPDQNFLKIHEELGELTKAYLDYTGVRRNEEKRTKEEMHKDLSHELADLVGLCLLFAKKYDINLKQAIQDKWLKWLEED